ncbi:electron transport complex subunit RsxG [Betaproteobacteria bacterium]|nr:electron transport complex subunit RsxG [Betaproteobacteria bacterium]
MKRSLLSRLPPAWHSALTSAFGLVAFTLVFTSLMAFVHDITREDIRAAVEAQQMRLIDEVLPREHYDTALLQEEVNAAAPAPFIGRIWRARRADQPVALVFETFADDGYGGRIKLIVALKADNTLGGVRVVSHHETPGLGDYIDPAKDRNKTTPWIAQFVGLDAGLPGERWAIHKDGGEITFHTGATISARAVTHGVGRAVAWVSARRDELFNAPANAPTSAQGQKE